MRGPIKDKIKSNFLDDLEKLYANENITQAEMAKRLEVGLRTFQNWIEKRNYPSQKSLLIVRENLRKEFKVDIDTDNHIVPFINNAIYEGGEMNKLILSSECKGEMIVDEKTDNHIVPFINNAIYEGGEMNKLILSSECKDEMIVDEKTDNHIVPFINNDIYEGSEMNKLILSSECEGEMIVDEKTNNDIFLLSWGQSVANKYRNEVCKNKAVLNVNLKISEIQNKLYGKRKDFLARLKHKQENGESLFRKMIINILARGSDYYNKKIDEKFICIVMSSVTVVIGILMMCITNSFLKTLWELLAIVVCMMIIVKKEYQKYVLKSLINVAILFMLLLICWNNKTYYDTYLLLYGCYFYILAIIIMCNDFLFSFLLGLESSDERVKYIENKINEIENKVVL